MVVLVAQDEESRLTKVVGHSPSLFPVRPRADCPHCWPSLSASVGHIGRRWSSLGNEVCFPSFESWTAQSKGPLNVYKNLQWCVVAITFNKPNLNPSSFWCTAHCIW